MNIKIKFSSNYKQNKMTSDALNDMRKVKLQVNNIFYDLYYNLLSLHKISTFFNEKKSNIRPFTNSKVKLSAN